MVVYSVRQGDTLLKIARSYGVLPEVITEANDLGEDAVLEKGQKLLIPLFY
jgi:LysM repeat protein